MNESLPTTKQQQNRQMMSKIQMPLLVFGLIVGVIAYLAKVHPDIIVVLLPRYADAYFVRAMYPRDRKNYEEAGVNKLKHLPFVSKLIPSKTFSVSDIISSNGFPVLVKNFTSIDEEKIIQKIIEANAGKELRMLSFENWKEPHFSPSCAIPLPIKSVKFDEFGRNHFGKNAQNHSYWYAGFEAITDAKAVEELTGYSWRESVDYRQNNMFVSNFPHEILTAPLHGAPIDSVSVQLFGTKTWYFISPEDITAIPTVPMPTIFTLPMTDDELLSKLKHVYVVKQEPGDLLYFGPHWSHAVSTSAGPNLMFNIRVNGMEKLKQGPKSLLMKLLFRKFTRVFAGLPQDNMVNYPILYEDLNAYYPECEKSQMFAKLLEQVQE